MSGPFAMPYPVLSGWRPHKCSICSKEYPTATVLKTHEKSHSGLKPFPCLQCDKAFKSAVSLKNHANSHSAKDAVLAGASAPPGGIKDTAAGQLGGVVGRTSSAEQGAQKKLGRKANAGGVDSSRPKGWMEAIAEQAEAAAAKRQKINSGGAAVTDAVPDAVTVPGPVSAADVCWNAVRKAGAAAAGGHAVGSRAQDDHARANVKPPAPMTGPAVAMLYPYPVLSGWQPHACSICKKEYPTATVLRTHEKSHSGLKPFPCGKCDKAFKSALALSRHQPLM
ncbi:hypothetical protein T484DRAFT_1874738 [Baffinella frigidus]|nr:hypothetical protein T484DRAFT_1874738 [Cryptophyta sp. CCMP2293]